jgi:DNA-binding MarR family transcriptional regulator
MKTEKPKAKEILGGLDHRTTYRFSMIAALHARAFSTVYSRKYRLNVNTWKVLSVVGRFGPMSANSTGGHSSLEPDKVTRAVDALVKQGLVLRRQDPPDRRRVVLSLSVKGRRVHDELSQLRDAMEYEFLSVLSSDEIATLYRIIDKLETQAVKLFTNKEVWHEVIERLPIKTAAKQGRRKAAIHDASYQRKVKAILEGERTSPSQPSSHLRA